MKPWLVMSTVIALAPATLFAVEAPDKTTKPILRIAFFTPSDVEPPEGVRERVKQIVEYTQAFFENGLDHWGYECDRPLPVECDDEGFPVIHYVRGQHTLASGRYDQHGFQQEVIRTASQRAGIPPHGQVWWIFVYKAVEQGWGRGAGDFRRGGLSTAYFYTASGDVKSTDDLASEFLVELRLKGAIHELGHALGLPHIGPKKSDALGNSLMGPINKVYFAQVNPQETRVYLSEASAAMLWKHPLFSGDATKRHLAPQAQLEDFQAAYDEDDDQLVVTGKLKSDDPAHSVIIANGTIATRSPYWLKYFAGKVEQDGTFRVAVDELDRTDGLLKIVFCFDNGAVVGANSRLGINAGFAKPYRFDGQEFELVDSPHPRAERLFSRPQRPSGSKPRPLDGRNGRPKQRAVRQLPPE